LNTALRAGAAAPRPHANKPSSLGIDNIKPWLKSRIFECISWLKCSIFGVKIGAFEQGSQLKIYGMAPMTPLTSVTSFCLHIYTLSIDLAWLQVD
jgi:hypothetical protein